VVYNDTGTSGIEKGQNGKEKGEATTRRKRGGGRGGKEKKNLSSLLA